jgi:hypothetical protein
MNAWLLYQQRRFMRQDGARYLRPDIGRYLASERKWEGQPRVGAGGPDGGQFTFGVQSDEASSETDRPRVQIDAPMWYDSDRDGAGEGDDYLDHLWPASSPPGMGHNQGPELDGAPEIPQSMPQTREERMAFVRAAASWLFGRSAIGVAAFFGLLDQVDDIATLSHMIRTANDPPAPLGELQRRAQRPSEPGYHDHHVVNQHQYNRNRFGDDRVDQPANLVRIPHLKHIELSRWYATKNLEYGGKSPQEVLRNMSWEEQTWIGLERLRYFKVLE